jgi:hypothetical protein
MDRPAQIDLLKRLLRYIETKTTALADLPWQNDTSVYFDPEYFAREERILFRQYPLLMGFASDWPAPGSFRTDDYAGVPILEFSQPTRRQFMPLPLGKQSDAKRLSPR